jgi:signal transduction histidine kinase
VEDAQAPAGTSSAGPAQPLAPAPVASAGGRRRPWFSYAATRSSFASSIRLALLLIATLVAPLVGTDDLETLRYLVAVIVVALVGTSLPDTHRLKLPVLVLEALLSTVGVVATADPSLPLLICLPSTTIAAGLSAGYLGTTLTGGTAAAVLLAGRVLRGSDPQAAAYSASAAQWVLVALLSGVLAARIHGLSAAPSPMDRYAEARRLLAQLRAVTRGLEGSLDPGTVAQTLMDDCNAVGRAEHGAVLLHVGGDQLVPLALHGYQRVPWRADLAADGPITRAWTSGAPLVDRRLPDTGGGGVRAGSTLLVLPIVVGDSRVGVVALEWRVDGYTPELLPALVEAVERHALPLETAALFDELRIAAATEERSRLAREMHDGIAQDLAFLGYQLDALTSVLRRTGSEEGVQQARALRGQMTSLISDLRLSISDLRSSVGPGRGLGAALSEYARSAGTSSGIRVHLSLKEGSTRLPADAEVQLLRIAHEAVGRARRRPGTANLFVTLEVDPPTASLVIEDDAPNTEETVTTGTSADRAMHERAMKLGARFSAEHSVPTGTRVSVTLGGKTP